MVYHVYPYLAQFSDVDQIHHINGSKAWKPGEVSKPGTWMWIKSKIWYGLVWYHTVSHCFYPFFFWISVLRCATKTKKNRRSTATCYRIGLWTARWQDPHHIFPSSSRLIRSQSSMLGTWKIPTSLDPNSPTNAQLRRPAGSEILKVIWNMSLECAAWKESEQILKNYSWIYGLKIL